MNLKECWLAVLLLYSALLFASEAARVHNLQSGNYRRKPLMSTRKLATRPENFGISSAIIRKRRDGLAWFLDASKMVDLKKKVSPSYLPEGGLHTSIPWKDYFQNGVSSFQLEKEELRLYSPEEISKEREKNVSRKITRGRGAPKSLAAFIGRRLEPLEVPGPFLKERNARESARRNVHVTTKSNFDELMEKVDLFDLETLLKFLRTVAKKQLRTEPDLSKLVNALEKDESKIAAVKDSSGSYSSSESSVEWNELSSQDSKDEDSLGDLFTSTLMPLEISKYFKSSPLDSPRKSPKDIVQSLDYDGDESTSSPTLTVSTGAIVRNGVTEIPATYADSTELEVTSSYLKVQEMYPIYNKDKDEEISLSRPPILVGNNMTGNSYESTDKENSTNLQVGSLIIEEYSGNDTALPFYLNSKLRKTSLDDQRKARSGERSKPKTERENELRNMKNPRISGVNSPVVYSRRMQLMRASELGTTKEPRTALSHLPVLVENRESAAAEAITDPNNTSLVNSSASESYPESTTKSRPHKKSGVATAVVLSEKTQTQSSAVVANTTTPSSTTEKTPSNETSGDSSSAKEAGMATSSQATSYPVPKVTSSPSMSPTQKTVADPETGSSAYNTTGLVLSSTASPSKVTTSKAATPAITKGSSEDGSSPPPSPTTLAAAPRTTAEADRHPESTNATLVTVNSTAILVNSTGSTLSSTGSTLGSAGSTLGSAGSTLGSTESTVNSTESTVNSTTGFVNSTGGTLNSTRSTLSSTGSTLGSTVNSTWHVVPTTYSYDSYGPDSSRSTEIRKTTDAPHTDPLTVKVTEEEGTDEPTDSSAAAKMLTESSVRVSSKTESSSSGSSSTRESTFDFDRTSIGSPEQSTSTDASANISRIALTISDKESDHGNSVILGCAITACVGLGIMVLGIIVFLIVRKAKSDLVSLRTSTRRGSMSANTRV